MGRFHKTLLVCSEACDEVERCLVAAGCDVVKASDGEQAVSQTLRQVFDAAIITSTGNKMDLAETVFNLRDIRDSMQIIMVADDADRGQGGATKEILAHLVSNTKVLTVRGLSDLLASPECSEEQRKR